MITLKVTSDRQLTEKYYNEAGVPFSEYSNLLLATDKEGILGYCLFDIDTVLTVHIIEPLSDLSLLDGVLRSTLHVGCERGVVDAFYTDTAPAAAFNTLNFIKNSDEKRLDVDKLFKSCCSCK
ncbi:MAG: hypothetical protein J6C27_05430 [Clostridia bacterium]|nr:hypothetical protein [Clostridia bacterium]